MGNSNSNRKQKYNFAYTNGDKYEGEILEGLREGFGTYLYQTGDKYIGYWHENEKHGTGTFYARDGNLYVGQWRNNQKDGVGTYYFKTGEKYVGEFKFGKKEGRGYWLSNDGNRYVGYFLDNKKNGSGIIYLANGKKCRELWKNGVLIEFEQIIDKTIEETRLVPLDQEAKLNNLNTNVTSNDNFLDNSFENYIGIQRSLN